MPTATISSLPHELLAIAFKDLAKVTPQDRRPLTALHLIHTCRKFREIAMVCPELWTTIGGLRSFGSGDAGLGCEWVNLFLQRSKALPLDIIVECRAFEIAPSEASPIAGAVPVLDLVYSKCIPLLERWRSVTWRVKSTKPALIPGVEGVGVLLSTAKCGSRKQSAPNLEKIIFEVDSLIPTPTVPVKKQKWVCPTYLPTLEYEDGKYFTQLKSIDFFLRWNMPILEEFEAKDLPHMIQLRPFMWPRLRKYGFGFKTITGSWSNGWLGSPLYDLAIFGSFLDKLTTLHLSFGHKCCFQSCLGTSLALESVLEFHLSYVYVKDQNRGSLGVEDVFGRMQFPKAHTLNLTLGIEDHDDFHVRKMARAVINGLHNYPVVQNFDLEISSDFSRSGEQEARISLELPLSMLPSLNHLNIRSSIDLILVDMKRYPALGTPQYPFPLLRSISLRVPKYEDWLPWLGIVISRVKLENNWEKFENVVIKGQGSEEATEIVWAVNEIEEWLEGHGPPSDSERK